MHSNTPFNYCIDSFLNKDVAQKVERSFRKREERGWLAPHLKFFRKAQKSKNELRETVLLDQKKTLKCTSVIRREASETVLLIEKTISARIATVYLGMTSKETLLYWYVSQRPSSDINNSVWPHQRGNSIEKASHWNVRNKWIDDPHRHSQN